MRKCRKIQVIKSLLFAVFLMTITSVYASETRQNKELPIYIGREKQGAGVKVEQVEKQIWAHVADYQEEDLQALIEELKGRSGEVYLSLYGKNLEEQQQVQAIYSLLFDHEELKALTDLKLHFVYTPLDEKDLLFKEMPFIKVLNMHVDQEEDQKLIDAGLLDSNYKDEILKQSNKNLRATERVQVWYGSPLKKSHRIESYQLDGTFNFAITETSTLYVNSSKQIRVLVSLSNLNQGVATVTSKSTSNGNYVGTGSTSQGSATINYKLPSGKTYVANPKFSVKNLGYGPGTDTFSIIADYTYTK